MKKLDKLLFGFALLTITFLISCGGGGDDPIPCSEIQWDVLITAKTDATCTSQGSFTIEVESGGEPPFVYSLEGGPGQATGTFSNLDAGIYTVVITDANSCMAGGQVPIELDGNTITFTTSTADSGCGTSNGSITVADASTTGTSNFEYSLDGGAFGTTSTFEGLNRGIYSVTVRDGDQCTETEQNIHVKSGILYSASVASIIDSNCAITDCHVAGTGRQDFTVLSTVQSNAAGILSRTSNGSMPPSSSGRTLTDDQKEAIACWVDDGAPDN